MIDRRKDISHTLAVVNKEMKNDEKVKGPVLYMNHHYFK